MARPSQDAIDTFISCTGSTEATAIQKLEENHGDLNAAVNAYFSEGDRRNLPAADDDLMNIDNHVNDETPQPTFPLLSAARSVNPFSLLDPNIGRNFFDRATDFPGLSPIVSHPREVREIPIEFKDGNNDSSSSAHRPVIEDVTGAVSIPGSETHGTVIIDDDVDEDEDIPYASADHGTSDNEIHNASGDVPFGTHPQPGVTPYVDLIDYNNDIEEEMIQAAIEASKHDAGGYPNQHSDVPNQPSGSHFEGRSPPFEDSDLARAVSLSLKTAEQERALREQEDQANEAQPSHVSDIKQEEVTTLANGSRVNSVEENLFVHEEDEEEEQPLVRHRSRRLGTGNGGSEQVIDSSSSSPEQHDASVHPQNNGIAFQSDEWGGISNEEHDEAVMLEAAMFGGVPDNTAYQFPYSSHQAFQNSSSSFYPRVPRPPSPSLVEQRLLREQQDDEYLAALQADREKELKFTQEAERRQLEEAAARQASLERERHQEEENRRKMLEEEEFKRELAAKEASLPQEPGPDDESAVTLLVRMPDGSRQGRRFSKSDKLQFLFDFIDIGRLVKPGTYRLVRPFPRRAFTVGEGELTLNELGLTSKQEALFLELV